jgi:hypothetical protein
VPLGGQTVTNQVYGFIHYAVGGLLTQIHQSGWLVVLCFVYHWLYTPSSDGRHMVGICMYIDDLQRKRSSRAAGFVGGCFPYHGIGMACVASLIIVFCITKGFAVQMELV